jgi:hypothetical protein
MMDNGVVSSQSEPSQSQGTSGAAAWVPTLRDSELCRLTRERDEQLGDGCGWRLPTTYTIKLIKSIAARQMAAEGADEIHLLDLVRFNGYERDVGARFVAALNLKPAAFAALAGPNTLSLAEAQRLDWGAFIKDPSVSVVVQFIQTANAQARAAKEAYIIVIAGAHAWFVGVGARTHSMHHERTNERTNERTRARDQTRLFHTDSHALTARTYARTHLRTHDARVHTPQ